MKLLILCVGNLMMRDDGFGLAVLDAAGKKMHHRARIGRLCQEQKGV